MNGQSNKGLFICVLLVVKMLVTTKKLRTQHQPENHPLNEFTNFVAAKTLVLQSFNVALSF